ncbi:MAG TPA: 4'-phosphopantetheinyl transferase superfamily protein [Solirubrobacteraceae bacterium]|nr:4'-phosphopantetheinyl transferase superfamily protein [Solirubrobacteraceae bacterium]
MLPARDELHLWRIDAAGATPPERRERSRSACEAILTDYLDGPPLIVRNRTGRPHSEPAQAAGLAFSSSHSGARAVLAVARRAAVGVDIEVLARRRRIVSAALDPAEVDRVQGADPAQQLALFLRHWAAKEAYVKALGTGFHGIEPREVPVAIEDGRITLRRPRDRRRWSLAALDPWPGVVGAVAVSGEPLAISTFDTAP